MSWIAVSSSMEAAANACTLANCAISARAVDTPTLRMPSAATNHTGELFLEFSIAFNTLSVFFSLPMMPASTSWSRWFFSL